MKSNHLKYYTMKAFSIFIVVLSLSLLNVHSQSPVGIGTEAPDGAEVLFDGSANSLNENWIYWEGPRLAVAMAGDGKRSINWEIVNDPVDKGTVVSSDDPAVVDHKYGSADIVTKKEYLDFRLHVEFLIEEEGGNSGVYLQNRYEIQILDNDSTQHGMAAVINEIDSPYYAYNGVGNWNSYDIVFRAARFKDGKRTEKALVTNYFNGTKVYSNIGINQVWGGANSGIDGGNDEGKGITDSPGGIKLQAEGYSVLYRNIWIKELNLTEPDTDF